MIYAGFAASKGSPPLPGPDDRLVFAVAGTLLRDANKKTNPKRFSHVVKVHESQEIFDGQTSTTG
jgi:hypothetical protein